ncbi:hypothetical protein [Thalassobacillus sp. C254]|uniref:hypothetical protein n=1 Tax=Thalassobacillus sp. C254 TaxID=1225341 RepID=UPI0018DDF8BB|nr:hypothetical protein [Thalassobacillus sp. C254]
MRNVITVSFIDPLLDEFCGSFFTILPHGSRVTLHFCKDHKPMKHALTLLARRIYAGR